MRAKLDRFDFDNPPIDPIELTYSLVETMIAHGGLGLSANQIEIPYKVFAVAANPVLVCFNPIILDVSSETVELEEGCLTFPNLILKIERPKSIKIRYTMPNGEVVNNMYTGMTARIMQHQYDYMNGVLFTEHVGPVTLALAKMKAKKANKI